MKSIKLRDRIALNLLGAIAVSLFISIASFLAIIRMIGYFIQDKQPIDVPISIYYLIIVLVLLFSISTFIMTFIFLIRKKLTYLKLISESIHHIANGEMGLTIDMKGKDELTQLAKNINYMSMELDNKFQYERQLEREKNELITNVSHDLRTPLTSIIGYLDLLKRGEFTNKEQLQEYLEITYLKSHRLKLLIDELFEYTRLSNPNYKLNRNIVNIRDLLEQIVGEYIPIFEKEQLSVKKSIEDADISILMDTEKLVRVFDNLISNAIKYSDKPSEVNISLLNKGNYAIFEISNEVEKPPSIDLNKLFERFFMGDKARMSNNGAGLGLAISKRIVELHDGRMYVEYKDKKINFIVEFPLYVNNL